MKLSSLCIALFLVIPLHAAAADSAAVWDPYLDYAYVYSSADGPALKKRLAEYGREAGATLAEYVHEQYETAVPDDGKPFDDARARRRAIAYLLLYLSEGEPNHLETSVEAARELSDWLGRHENRYWYHTIHAYRAMEKGHRFDFVGELLDLWLQVVVPLETPYETLHTLSLSETPNSGFVSALPYIYENLARMILIRSQQMGIDRDLDPLAAIVRLLHDGRVGGQPDVIPVEASSREYVARIVERLDGPESDAGSLTFTLALFEASKLHERARSLLATEGLGPETLKSIRVATGAYAAAQNRADTIQGQCAVYTRVLRQMGEVYAAKQRLEVDPEIESPFSIEGAIDVYADMARKLDGGWEELGYRTTGRPSYIDGMHRLWEEIQEVSLTAADYYLAKSALQPHSADEQTRNAARIHTRYLALFSEFATAESLGAVPDSAYFAAYEAARGYGDAILLYGQGSPNPDELETATRRYVAALTLYPFDRSAWPALTFALQRQGRESDYLSLVRPVTHSVTRSRHVNAWIEKREAGADSIEPMRSALSDSLAIMHLGFAEADGVDRLESGLDELRRERAAVAEQLAATGMPPGPSAPANVDAGLALADNPGESLDRAESKRRAAELANLLERQDHQLDARSRALPLYIRVVESEDLTPQLRVDRNHPVHTLLRRMYHENRS